MHDARPSQSPRPPNLAVGGDNRQDAKAAKDFCICAHSEGRCTTAAPCHEQRPPGPARIPPILPWRSWRLGGYPLGWLAGAAVGGGDGVLEEHGDGHGAD